MTRARMPDSLSTRTEMVALRWVVSVGLGIVVNQECSRDTVMARHRGGRVMPRRGQSAQEAD